jgi:hypothetical protein
MLELILETYPEESFLKADGFDEAIIGIEEPSLRLIYSIKKTIEILIEEGMTEEDAQEHFSYNVSGGYVGELTPIWCEDRF